MYTAGKINGIFLVVNKNCYNSEVFVLVLIHYTQENIAS